MKEGEVRDGRSESGPPEPWRRRASGTPRRSRKPSTLSHEPSTINFSCPPDGAASAGRPAFEFVKQDERKERWSESGPPEPWRRRAYSYAYVLRAINEPDRIYIGWTNDLRQRLKEHNRGMSPHTAGHRPWELAWYGAFWSEAAGRDFERYLKSGSGRAFLRRRLLM
jgi:putative endonuclease